LTELTPLDWAKVAGNAQSKMQLKNWNAWGDIP
jgi:hypothetical protein